MHHPSSLLQNLEIQKQIQEVLEPWFPSVLAGNMPLIPPYGQTVPLDIDMWPTFAKCM